MNPGVRYARALLCWLLLFTSLPQAPSSAADGKPTLYVYVHTDAKSASLEKGLQDKLPALEVTVFGRFRDFEEAMGSRKPDGVVAIAPLIASLNVPVALQGNRGNNDWEPYVLLSGGNPLEGSLSGKVIGVVDLLGRDATQDFVTKLLKTPDVKLKRVTKMEDLLPLLQFSAADGVLVPAAAVKSITERSRLPLKVRELPEARVGLLAVGVVNAKVRELVIKQFLSLDGATNQSLGVEKWRAR
jgi:hypothetical protein